MYADVVHGEVWICGLCWLHHAHSVLLTVSTLTSKARKTLLVCNMFVYNC